MRLAQLARKLGVQPEEIVVFLAENGHEFENEVNGKLSLEQQCLAEAYFAMKGEEQLMMEAAETIEAKPQKAEIPEPETTNEERETEESTDAAHEVPFGPPAHTTSQVSDSEEEKAPLSPPKKIDLEPTPWVNVYKALDQDKSYANAELIKTETPQLKGLKVVGKIELPEPKKPKAKPESGDTKEKADDEQKSNRNQKNKGWKSRKAKQRLNPIEYERRKAEKEARRKKAEAAKKLKQKKKEHYLTNVKPKAPSAKPKDEAYEEEEIAPVPIVGMSGTKAGVPTGSKTKKGLGKFWAWLKGEYDKTEY